MPSGSVAVRSRCTLAAVQEQAGRNGVHIFEECLSRRVDRESIGNALSPPESELAR